MSEQALDLRSSLRILWRHKVIVAIATGLGLAAGVAFTVLRPPMPASEALVGLPPSAAWQIRSEVLIAGSDPVLGGAIRLIDPPVSLQVLRSRIQVKSLTPTIILIGARGATAGQAEKAANAVASSYIAFVSSGKPAGGAVQAGMLEPATDATQTSLLIRLIITGAIGFLLGVLLGAIVALAVGRRDRRLGRRDEMADSIGVPVLASISVGDPSGVAGWMKLLRKSQPGTADAWSLRRALRQLGLPGVNHTDFGTGSGSSLAVLSLSSDPKALALGPQLAVFAASLGIPTTLVVGPQQDVNVTATLRAACAAQPELSGRTGNLQVTVSNHHNADELPGGRLVVAVAVVDSETPRVGDTMRAAATALGVSAGAATAEQLARVSASATADGRDIVGVLVADPDPADHTTGRLPELARLTQRRMPTRITGISAGTRR